MDKSARRTGRALAAGFLVWSSIVVAAPVSEYELKAAFLYNFAVFTEWPADAPPGMRVCLIGQDPFGAALDALTGKPVRGIPVEVLRVRELSETRACHVLFIGSSPSPGFAAVIAAMRKSPVLTVADGVEAVRTGVVIGLTVDDRRIVFEVNADSAKSARLNLSSRLLKLARRIYP